MSFADEAKLHQRLFLQTCQGVPSPENLKKTLSALTKNEDYASRVAAELDLEIQKRRLSNGRAGAE